MRRTWNEKANEYQRDPYTQAKAQLENNYNRNRDMGLDTPKPTEEGVQVAARQIARGAQKSPEEASVRAARRNLELGKKAKAVKEGAKNGD